MTREESLETAIRVLTELEERGREHVTPLLDKLLEDRERLMQGRARRAAFKAEMGLAPSPTAPVATIAGETSGEGE